MNRNRLTPYRNTTGKKHDRGRQRGRKNRQRHFVPAFFRRHFRCLSHFEMPENIFENDHGIIDQARKHQCQST